MSAIDHAAVIIQIVTAAVMFYAAYLITVLGGESE